MNLFLFPIKIESNTPQPKKKTLYQKCLLSKWMYWNAARDQEFKLCTLYQKYLLSKWLYWNNKFAARDWEIPQSVLLLPCKMHLVGPLCLILAQATIALDQDLPVRVIFSPFCIIKYQRINDELAYCVLYLPESKALLYFTIPIKVNADKQTILFIFSPNKFFLQNTNASSWITPGEIIVTNKTVSHCGCRQHKTICTCTHGPHPVLFHAYLCKLCVLYILFCTINYYVS